MSRWIGSWHASQTKFAPRFFEFTFPQVSFHNQTIRMIIHPHAYGSQLRLKFSNRYGTEPVIIGKVAIARHIQDGKTAPQTEHDVHFQGQPQVTIPGGEERYSDPIPCTIDAQSDLAVSIYLPAYTQTSTWHFTPAQLTYVTDGDQVKEHDASHFKTKIDSYYWLTGLDVLTEEENSQVIVALGDSITDGFSATPNANHRWPDFLRDRVRQEYPDLNLSILNAGITGNLISADGADFDIEIAGEKAFKRLEWDVFSQSGVEDVIFLEGTNDLFGEFSADLIIGGMQEIAKKVHDQSLRIFIGTLMPFGNSIYYSEEKERVRQDVNRWIRSNDLFDGVIDFDQVLANPQMPNQLLSVYDSGDHAHPNDEGFKALAYAVPLSFILRSKSG